MDEVISHLQHFNKYVDLGGSYVIRVMKLFEQVPLHFGIVSWRNCT